MTITALLILQGAVAFTPPRPGAPHLPARQAYNIARFSRACADPGNVAPTAKPKAAETPMSPQAAVEEMGSLLEQVKLVWTEGSSWSPEERASRRRDLVETYVRVFAPALSFSFAQLSLSLSVFLLTLLSLNLSGRGYADIADLVAGFPVVPDLLAKVDPGWGNVAIALVIIEVLSPLLLPVAAAATPSLSAALQRKLEELGFDAEGLDAQLAKVTGDKA